MDLLGSAFYVMDQLDGRVPTDNPPYHADGWLKTEASPDERAQIWWGGIESLAAIHRLDYQKLGFDFVDRPELGDDGLQQGLAYYARYYEWAARGVAHPTAEAAYEWLVKNAPTSHEPRWPVANTPPLPLSRNASTCSRPSSVEAATTSSPSMVCRRKLSSQ